MVSLRGHTISSEVCLPSVASNFVCCAFKRSEIVAEGGSVDVFTVAEALCRRSMR